MSRQPGEVREGDAVAIRLLNSSNTEEEFSGQVQQVVESGDGSKSYIVACPFQVGPEHIRVIVPVEQLAKPAADKTTDPRVSYVDGTKMTDRR